MANGEEKSKDLYAVLGLEKECTELELRNAYKKLALKWHPDRCSSSGNSKYVDEAKKKFQSIQQAYSVLSDANKRFLYDVGVYDSDDDENGMGDFLNEMAVMMSQTKPNETREESFEELQELFQEMFQGDIESFSSSSQTATACFTSSSSYASCCGSSSSTNKRGSFEMNYGKTSIMDSSGFDFDSHFQNFCLGVDQQQATGKEKEVRGKFRGGGGTANNSRRNGRTANNSRRNGRKQKVSSGHDVSSSGISAA